MKTHDLENALNNIHDENKLDTFLEDMDSLPSSFLEYFQSNDKVRSMETSTLIEKSGIERTYCYHVLKGNKNPGRDKIIRLCLAAGFDNEEAGRALKCAKISPLYVKSKRDALIQYAFNKHLSVIDTNLLLEKHQEDPLD